MPDDGDRLADNTDVSLDNGIRRRDTSPTDNNVQSGHNMRPSSHERRPIDGADSSNAESSTISVGVATSTFNEGG